MMICSSGRDKTWFQCCDDCCLFRLILNIVPGQVVKEMKAARVQPTGITYDSLIEISVGVEHGEGHLQLGRDRASGRPQAERPLLLARHAGSGRRRRW